MQSVNEELQSTNEELETSKEELQSVNEELATVNAELQTKVADLSRANNDMNNLLAGTGIGTVFVDHQLRILRFTPAATQIINLILSDVGRPVGHIVSNLVGYDRLVADVQAVLDTLIPKEVEVQTQAGEWYTMRILPYRTLDNVIEGAVITFVDITEARQWVEDVWLGVKPRRWLMNVRDRIPEGLREEALAKYISLARLKFWSRIVPNGSPKRVTVVEVWMTSTALVNEAGQMYAIATTERATGDKRSGQQWKAQNDQPRMTGPATPPNCAGGPKRWPGKKRPSRRKTSRPCRPRKRGGRSTNCGCIRSSWRCRTRNCAGRRRNWTPRGRAISTSTTWRRWAIAPSASRG